MASAMFRALSLPTNSSEAGGCSPKVLESVDSIIEGWLLLLPESKRDIFSADGQVDELLFQAMMALHAFVFATYPSKSLMLTALLLQNNRRTP